MKKGLIALVVIVIVGLGAWYFASGKFAMPSATTGGTATTTSTTVATVNGKAITQGQLTAAENQLAAQAQVSLASLDASTTKQVEQQALNNLINQQLVLQAAEQGGFTASSTQVDAQVAATKQQLGSDQAYQQALQQQGLTEDQFKAQLAQNLTMQNYLEATLHLSAATASDSEIQSLYNQLKAQTQGTTTPPLSQVKTQVKQLVINQKQQAQIAQLVQQLRAQANVQVFI